MSSHEQRQRIGGIALSLALAMFAGVAAHAAPDDAIRWRVRMIPEHREFIGVWVDTRQLGPDRAIERVALDVECLDAKAAPIGSQVFLFTDGARPSLQRGVVHLRYFRHSCAQAHQIVGARLRYTETGQGVEPSASRTATLRTERIRAPSRQVELIGASPFHTTDPSAYCGPIDASAPASDPAAARGESRETREQ